MSKIPDPILAKLRGYSQEYDMSHPNDSSQKRLDLGKYDASHWIIIDRVSQLENYSKPAEAKDLQEATGLSRSATLKRCHELSEDGVLMETIKPGTQNRNYPPYIYTLSPEFKPRIEELLNTPIVQGQILRKQSQEADKVPDSEYQASSSSEKSESLFSDTYNDYLEEDQNEIRSKSKDLPTKEQNIGLILKKMAEEIAVLKKRVAFLEEELKAAKTPGSADSDDFEQILKILEEQPINN